MSDRWGIGVGVMVSEQSMLKICKTKKSTSQVKTNLLTNYKIQEFCENSEEVVFEINLKTILLYVGTIIE